jgi:hypothetical protein
MFIKNKNKKMFNHLQPKEIMRNHEKKIPTISNNLTDLLTAKTGKLST